MTQQDVNGLTINYELHGPEDAHGQGFNLEVWRPQIAAFRDRYRILVHDLRGHGGTGLGADETPSIEDMAADLIGLLDALGIGRVHYAGKSQGGMIGYALALDHRDRLESVTFVATQGVLPDSSTGRIRAAIDKMRAAGDTMEGGADTLLARYVTEDYKTREPEGFAALRRIVAANSVEGYARSSEAILAMNYDDRLAEIDVPTMVIAGECDQPTPPQRMELYRDGIKGARMAVVEGAGHLPNVEQPDGFNRALAEFLDGF